VKENIFEGKPKWYRKIWFYATCLRPITKYELSNLQLQLITIFEGLREGDLQHYQVERILESEIRKLKGGDGTTETKEKKEQQSDNMFN